MSGEPRPASEHAVLWRIAEALRRRVVEEGGWVTDVGILGPEAFLDQARQTINAISTRDEG